MKTHLDLFSGIGGFALAARWAGLQTIGFCEYEDYPRRVLAKHWPGVRIHGDIRDLDGSAYKGVGLITGGYPCQPFSLAGQRKGTEDDRHLWPEMLRVVAQARPTWVIAENVAGHVTMGLDQVLLDLEGEGYSGRAVVVPACAVDAPHRRDRVWIIGRNTNSDREPTGSVNAKTPKLPGDVADAGSGRCLQSEGRKMEQSRGTETERASEAMANSDCFGMEGERPEQQTAGVGRESENVPNSNGVSTQGVVRRAQQGGYKRPVGLHNRAGSTPDSDWWAVEPGMGRVAHGIPNRVDRLRGLGNAIVPQVAYQLIMSIQQVEQSEPAN